MMRPYQVYAVKHRRLHCPKQRQRLHLAHHRQRQTLTSFKASTCSKTTRTLKMPVRGGPQRPGPPDREEFNRFQEGCVEENTNTATLVRRLLSTTMPTRSSSPPSRSWAWRWTKTASATKAQRKTAKATYKEQLAPLATSASSSSLTNATARSLATTTRPSKRSSQGATVRLYRHAHFEANASRTQIEDASRPPCKDHRKTCFQNNCTPTPSPTPLKTPTCCASMWTTKPEGKTRPSPARPWPKGRDQAISWPSTTPPPPTAASTPCWPPPASTTPLNTTACLTRLQPNKPPTPPLCRSTSPACSRRRQRAMPTCGKSGEDLPQKRRTTRWTRGQKAALKAILATTTPLRHQPHHQRVRPVLPGRAKRIKDQQWAATADYPAAPQNRHHHRGGHAAHRV